MDQLEKEEMCMACKFKSRGMIPYHAIKNDNCWTLMVMELSSVHDEFMYASIFHVKVLVCPRCKTMRML